MKDINVWFVSFIDVFTYMIRFGVLTWLPLYLLETKGFTKAQWVRPLLSLNGQQFLLHY